MKGLCSGIMSPKPCSFSSCLSLLVSPPVALTAQQISNYRDLPVSEVERGHNQFFTDRLSWLSELDSFKRVHFKLALLAVRSKNTRDLQAAGQITFDLIMGPDIDRSVFICMAYDYCKSYNSRGKSEREVEEDQEWEAYLKLNQYDDPEPEVR